MTQASLSVYDNTGCQKSVYEVILDCMPDTEYIAANALWALFKERIEDALSDVPQDIREQFKPLIKGKGRNRSPPQEFTEYLCHMCLGEIIGYRRVEA